MRHHHEARLHKEMIRKFSVGMIMVIFEKCKGQLQVRGRQPGCSAAAAGGAPCPPIGQDSTPQTTLPVISSPLGRKLQAPVLFLDQTPLL